MSEGMVNSSACSSRKSGKRTQIRYWSKVPLLVALKILKEIHSMNKQQLFFLKLNISHSVLVTSAHVANLSFPTFFFYFKKMKQFYECGKFPFVRNTLVLSINQNENKDQNPTILFLALLHLCSCS
jgi:hypothetical protein